MWACRRIPCRCGGHAWGRHAFGVQGTPWCCCARAQAAGCTRPGCAGGSHGPADGACARESGAGTNSAAGCGVAAAAAVGEGVVAVDVEVLGGGAEVFGGVEVGLVAVAAVVVAVVEAVEVVDLAGPGGSVCPSFSWES